MYLFRCIYFRDSVGFLVISIVNLVERNSILEQRIFYYLLNYVSLV